MPWEDARQENAKLTVSTINRIVWNEATHQMKEYPDWVDLIYNEGEALFALIGRVDIGAYQVFANADNTYHIECQRALNQMGMKNLAQDYVVTPVALPVDPVGGEGDPPPVQARFNGIYAPVKP